MVGKYLLRASHASPALQGVKPPETDAAARGILLAGLGDDLHILIKCRQKLHQALDGNSVTVTVIRELVAVASTAADTVPLGVHRCGI
jgi:hypothetical protein